MIKHLSPCHLFLMCMYLQLSLTKYLLVDTYKIFIYLLDLHDLIIQFYFAVIYK